MDVLWILRLVVSFNNFPRSCLWCLCGRPKCGYVGRPLATLSFWRCFWVEIVRDNYCFHILLLGMWGGRIWILSVTTAGSAAETSRLCDLQVLYITQIVIVSKQNAEARNYHKGWKPVVDLAASSWEVCMGGVGGVELQCFQKIWACFPRNG